MRLTPLALPALALLPAFAQTAPAAAGVVPGPPTPAALAALLAEQDRRLFELAFGHRDDHALRALLADDFRFLHDKGGVVAATPEAFVRLLAEGFEGRASGRDVQARRELVPGSLATYTLGPDHALQVGRHRFFGLTPGQPDVLRETGQFVHHWVRAQGQWRLTRVYSFDHRPAGE